jgi:peptidoglycan/xylan/chitin deacetylase (PgdA/CDA1 family)
MTGSVPILMYHAVAEDPADATRRLSVSPRALEEQLVFLLEHGFTGLTFFDLAESFRVGAQLPSKPVVLTFDDGYADFAEHAWPIMRRHGFPGTVFVTTGWIADSGDRRAGEPFDRMLQWSQIRELADAGVEIGAHTHSHPQLDQLGDDDLLRELKDSRADLEEHLGAPVRTMAYPYGYNSSRVRTAARAAGYHFAAVVGNRRATASHDGFMLPRLTIRRSTDVATFAAAVTGPDRLFWKDRALTAGYATVRLARRASRQLHSNV